MPDLVLYNGRIIDGTGAAVKERAAVALTGERIDWVREGDYTPGGDAGEEIDLDGRTLLPGLINAHMHIMMGAEPDPIGALSGTPVAEAVLRGAKRGEQMLRAGITAARDLGGYEYAELALRDAFARGDFPGPRLLCSGKIITMTGGHGWMIGLESDGPDGVRRSARQNLKNGADCIKMMATGGVMTPGVEPGAQQLGEDELRAGVEEAHKTGRRTASHAQGTDGVKAAIRAGIDTIEHGIFLDDEAIQMMVERGVVYVPTLAAPYQIVEAGEEKGIPSYALEKSRRVIESHRRSFEQAAHAGVTVAAGNDGGTPFNPVHDLVTEIRLLAEWGLGNAPAIRAATHGSARALGLSEETGAVQAGKLADLLILDKGADPLGDIGALSQVWMVVKQGRRV